MAKKVQTFVCANCGEECDPNELSGSSLRAAGTRNHSEALELLMPDECTCTLCEMVLDDDGQTTGRNEQEKFYLSGLQLDRVQTEWLSLNY